MADHANTPRDAAVAIVTQLRQAGMTAYLAGGCVRDALLGLEPKDHDVATDATPDQIKQIFPKARLVGEAFGVALVRYKRHPIEVATFRREWGYADGRRPEAVHFTDARNDAMRRDLTINALFADPLSHEQPAPETDAHAPDDQPPPQLRHQPGLGMVIDYVGGLADLDAKRIRAVGDPDERFGEDYLRMLRAVRFAARLAFTLDERTAGAIRITAKYLGQISRERIGQELAWMLTGPHPDRAAALAQQLHLDSAILGEDHAQPDLPTLAALANATSNQPGPGDDAIGLIAWMIDRHVAPACTWNDPKQVLAGIELFVHGRLTRVLKRWRKALCLSNQQRDDIRQTLCLLTRAAEWDGLTVAQRKRLLADPQWPRAWALMQLLPIDALCRDMQPAIDALFAQGVAPEPWVTGEDLIELGLEPGPIFRKLLDQAYDDQLDGTTTSREHALERLARRV